MDPKDNLNASVLDRKTRAIMDDIVDMKVRRLWFENYEKNKELIKRSSKITDVPVISEAICVGAGPTLKKNIHELKGVDVPVLVCDKSAAAAAQYVKPYAVLAVNTEHTAVCRWLYEFNLVCKNRWGSVEDVWLIVPVTVNPEVFTEWSGKIAFINPSNTCPELTSVVYAETDIEPTLRGDNVGFFSVITAYSLGAETVVMLGMNYSYATMQEALTATMGYSYVYIHDLNNDEVYTTLDWLDCRSEFIAFCMEAMQDTKFINCSEGGVLYQVGVIAAMDFGVWKQFLEQQRREVGASKGTASVDDR